MRLAKVLKYDLEAPSGKSRQNCSGRILAEVGHIAATSVGPSHLSFLSNPPPAPLVSPPPTSYSPNSTPIRDAIVSPVFGKEVPYNLRPLGGARVAGPGAVASGGEGWRGGWANGVRPL